VLSTSAFSFSCQDLNSHSKSNKIGWTPIRSVIIRVKIDAEKHLKLDNQRDSITKRSRFVILMTKFTGKKQWQVLSTSAFSFSCQDLNSYSKSNKIGWTPIRSVIIRVKIDAEKHLKLDNQRNSITKRSRFVILMTKFTGKKQFVRGFGNIEEYSFTRRNQIDRAAGHANFVTQGLVITYLVIELFGISCYCAPCYWKPCYRRSCFRTPYYLTPCYSGPCDSKLCPF